MREWLSGGVSPCQGEGRGFESRLALLLPANKITYARVAQWWSIALPRRGSRVRIPSRALLGSNPVSRFFISRNSLVFQGFWLLFCIERRFCFLTNYFLGSMLEKIE